MKSFYIKSLIFAAVIGVLFGICFQFAKGTDSNTSDSTTAYNLSSWLSKNGVSVDKALIDLSTKYVVCPYMKNTITDRKTAAEKILGDNLTSSADTYRGSNGTVVFTNDSFKLTPEEGLFKKIVSGVDRYNTPKKAEKIVKALGFDLNGSIISSSTDINGFTAHITKTINSLPIFDDCITVVMDKDSIISVDGVWYIPEPGKHPKRKAKSAIDALTELAHQIGGSRKTSVTSMSLGYKLKHSDDVTELEPVWRFETDSRDVIYIGA